ncbi:MAG: nucleoside-triphosphatase, partial [Symbiobacteriaceae bacterium]|nr:nucleoside-triphosphatase [Symbiobacteriaceae bacterium]
MHLFLTGERGVGKSTAIKRFLAEQAKPYQGIQTYMGEVDAQGVQRVYGSAFGKKHDDEAYCIAVRQPGGRPVAVLSAFEVLLWGILDKLEASGGFIVLDELGFLEAEAVRFQEKVFT